MPVEGVELMDQPTFSDLEYQGKKRKKQPARTSRSTCRSRFLSSGSLTETLA